MSQLAKAQDAIARVIRPLNEKHEVVGVVAFLLTRDGDLLRHSDGDVKGVEAAMPQANKPKRPRAKKVKV